MACSTAWPRPRPSSTSRPGRRAVIVAHLGGLWTLGSFATDLFLPAMPRRPTPSAARLRRGPQRHDLPRRARARSAHRRPRERRPRPAADPARRTGRVHRLGARLRPRTDRGDADRDASHPGTAAAFGPRSPTPWSPTSPGARGGPALLLDRDHRRRGAAAGFADRRPDAPPAGVAGAVRRADRDQRLRPRVRRALVAGEPAAGEAGRPAASARRCTRWPGPDA